LPEIKRHKEKKVETSFNKSNASKDSQGSKNSKRIMKNREIGNSYISFNSINVNQNINHTHDDRSKNNKLEFTQKSINNTENDIRKMRETFES